MLTLMCRHSGRLMLKSCEQYFKLPVTMVTWCRIQRIHQHSNPANIGIGTPACGHKLSSQTQSISTSSYTSNDATEEPTNMPSPFYNYSTAEFDWTFLCDPANRREIKDNISSRKGVGDIDKVVELREEYLKETNPELKQHLWQDLTKAAAEIPNKSHSESPIGAEDQAKVVEIVGVKKEFPFTPRTVVEVCEGLGLLRTKNVVLASGDRTYYFIDELARLEQALVNFTVDRLLKKNFALVSVPDLLYPWVIEGCGFKTSGERNQVYRLDPTLHEETCLAGTAEMSLAGFFSGELLEEHKMPQKVCAVSRCYRAETSDSQEESGIYRVHQFNKVEMFALSRNETGEESDDLLQELVSIQRQLFSELQLDFRILDMPSQELGAPAYRKYDIEAWMPGKQIWGEISSASSCTDFQSRRLNIKYRTALRDIKHVHTVNGTACAVPRMIMAIVENGQTKDGNVDLPEILWPYMDGIQRLTNRTETMPVMKWIKQKRERK